MQVGALPGGPKRKGGLCHVRRVRGLRKRKKEDRRGFVGKKRGGWGRSPEIEEGGRERGLTTNETGASQGEKREAKRLMPGAPPFFVTRGRERGLHERKEF